MILYQSCVKQSQRNRTLTNKQQCNPENSKKELFREQNLNKVKTVKLAKLNFDQGKNST